MPRVRAGQLPHRVRIERPIIETRASGAAEIVAHESIDERWAFVHPVRGGERVIGGQVNAETTHQVQFRHGVDLKPSDRLGFGSRVFDVNALVNSDERGVSLMVEAIERDQQKHGVGVLNALHIVVSAEPETDLEIMVTQTPPVHQIELIRIGLSTVTATLGPDGNAPTLGDLIEAIQSMGAIVKILAPFTSATSTLMLAESTLDIPAGKSGFLQADYGGGA